jgi:hypothetical protein
MIDKQLEDAFEKAWEEYGDERPEDRVLRWTARFFFFTGGEAGVKLTEQIYKETYEKIATTNN